MKNKGYLIGCVAVTLGVFAAGSINFNKASSNQSSQESCEKAFSSIYDNRLWGSAEDGDPSSGWGSYKSAAEPYMEFLKEFISANGIKTVADLGCGSWEFSRYFDWSNVDYHGMDAVPSVLEITKNKFSAPNIHFQHGDILTSNLPDAELMICKDVLQHLQNEDIELFLTRIGKYKHCLITNDVAIGKDDNAEIAGFNRQNSVRGANRPLDLTKAPFNVKGAKVLTYPLDNDHIKQVLYINNQN